MKISKKAKEKFEYFKQGQNSLTLEQILLDPNGYSALECFNSFESTGKYLPCKEPEELQKALNGKATHGISVNMLAEDFVGRILFCEDILSYPLWIQNEIYTAAEKYAKKTLGFVPTFVKNRQDFTTMTEDL